MSFHPKSSIIKKNEAVRQNSEASGPANRDVKPMWVKLTKTTTVKRHATPSDMVKVERAGFSGWLTKSR